MMQAFSSLSGHDRAKSLLSRFSESKPIPPVLLFHGREGIGKKTCARIFAKEILDTSSFDLLFFAPEGNPQTYYLQTIHDWQKQIVQSPFSSQYRVSLFDDAHCLSLPCSQALLKTLEEPPRETITILITAFPEQLLPTITSRCFSLPFFPLSIEEMKQWLEKEKEQTTEVAEESAFFAEGSFEIALRFVDPAHLRARKMLFSFFSQAGEYDYVAVRQVTEEWIAAFSSNDHSFVAEDFFRCSLFWYRDLLQLQEEKEALLYLAHRRSLLAQRANVALPFPSSLQKVEKAIRQARQGLQRSVKLQYCLEHCIINCACETG